MRTATPLFPILGAAAFLMAGCSNPQAAVQSDLSGACSGQGVPEAAAYSGGGVHPVVLLASSGESHAWSDDLPEEWYPGAVEAAQLVACVGEEDEREIEVCLYNGPSITRFQYQVSLRLVEARTGAQVASTVLEGSMPRECRQSEDYDLTRLEGNHVAVAAARDWMRAYVERATVSASSAPQPAGAGPGEPSSDASFMGEWQATDAYDGSGMRLTITGDAADGYLVVWDDEYWSLCEGPAIVEATGSMDASDPNVLHTYWVVGCTVPGQVGEFAADFVYSEASDTLEQIYEEGIRETWYRASGP